MGSETSVFGGGWIGIGLMQTVAFWVLLILGIVALVKWLRGRYSKSKRDLKK